MQSWRSRPGRLLTALVVLLSAGQWLGVGQAAAAEVTIVSAGTSRTDGRVSLVVDVPSSAANPIPPGAFSVTAKTVPQPVDTVPLFSDQLAVGFVVDGSQDGGAALQSGLAGATNFVLEQPLAGAAVVADQSPPNVMSTPEARPADVVQALSAIQAEGQRQTSEALSVALRELERIPARSRMLILHTTAADAGGESAADLAARLIDAHIPLAVVSAAPDPAYWREVTGLTGGVLVVQEVGNGFAAFDEVADAMRSRYLLTFNPTWDPPFPITVQLDTADGATTADAVVPQAPPAPAAAPADAGGGTPWVLLLAIVAIVAVVVVPLFVVTRRARPALAGDTDAAASGPPDVGPPAPRIPRPARYSGPPILARQPARDHPRAADAEAHTVPISVDQPTAPIQISTSPIQISTSAPSPTGAAATEAPNAPAATVPTSTDPSRQPPGTEPTETRPPETRPPETEPAETESPRGSDTPARARNGAAPPTRAANGTDPALVAKPVPPLAAQRPAETPPTSTDQPIHAANGAARSADAPNGTDLDHSAGAPDQADTAMPPRPRSAEPPASEPPPDPNAEPVIEAGTCVCGCGRPVRPGRAFINWEHQSRWMRAAWDRGPGA